MANKKLPKLNAVDTAWAAINQLIAAYKQAEINATSIDWQDLDDAHNLALEAVRLKRREESGDPARR